MTTTKDVTVRKEPEVQKAVPTRMLNPWDEMDRLFERLLPRGWMRPMGWGTPFFGELAEPLEMRPPRVDLIDGEENIVIRAEVPGVEKKDLEIAVDDATVTIKGKVMREHKEEKGDYYRCEIGSGEFTRILALPCAVNGAKAAAHLKNGMLEVTLPKVEKARRHRIAVA